jgi:hypothetical protein
MSDINIQMKKKQKKTKTTTKTKPSQQTTYIQVLSSELLSHADIQLHQPLAARNGPHAFH